jgi:hypothetical protein
MGVLTSLLLTLRRSKALARSGVKTPVRLSQIASIVNTARSVHYAPHRGLLRVQD